MCVMPGRDTPEGMQIQPARYLEQEGALHRSKVNGSGGAASFMLIDYPLQHPHMNHPPRLLLFTHTHMHAISGVSCADLVGIK
jgi:hypothetical protein